MVSIFEITKSGKKIKRSFSSKEKANNFLGKALEKGSDFSMKDFNKVALGKNGRKVKWSL